MRRKPQGGGRDQAIKKFLHQMESQSSKGRLRSMGSQSPTIGYNIWSRITPIVGWLTNANVRESFVNSLFALTSGMRDGAKPIFESGLFKVSQINQSIHQRRERQRDSNSEGPMKQFMQTFMSWGIAAKLVALFLVFGIVPMVAVGYMGYSAGQEMQNTAGLRFQN